MSAKNRVPLLTAATALHNQGRLDEAERLYAQLIAADPRDADALHLVGVIALQRGDHDGAVALIRHALACGLAGAHAHLNLGAAYRAKGLLGEATEQYRAALALDPRSSAARNNLANALLLMGDAEGAVEQLRAALALAPRDAAVRSNLLYALNLSAELAPDAVAREHRAWGASVEAPRAAHPNDRDPARRLRVGFVSSDLRTHSVAFFLCPLLEGLDRGAVEVVCYASGVRVDETTARIKALSDGWADVAGDSDAALAARVRADKIDVLVDLGGHTSGNRLGAFALRPAPVQVTWLGYPNTTGLAAIEYRVTDAVADPPGPDDARYPERLARLDGGFLCYEPWADAPAVSPPPAARGGAVTFGSFNNLSKLNARVVALWSRVLGAAPASTLLLKSSPLADAGTRALVERRFAAHGVGRERLRLAGEEPTVRRHLARYAEVDVALDPFPYNGTTTTCEALWMGVPVVTLAGDRHAARVGADLLHRVGLDDLVAPDEDAYVARAARLAHDRSALAARRAAQRELVARSPLCDRAAFARAMASAWRAMWQRWCSEGG
jgi:predicted O-linked N-acetylglucosamine transferase (SPINDLY family)